MIELAACIFIWMLMLFLKDNSLEKRYIGRVVPKIQLCRLQR